MWGMYTVPSLKYTTRQDGTEVLNIWVLLKPYPSQIGGKKWRDDNDGRNVKCSSMPVWPCLICSLRQKLLLLEVTVATFWRNVPSSYGRNFYSQHDGVIEWSIESSTEHTAAKWRKWKPFKRNNEYGMKGQMVMMMIIILATGDCHASIIRRVWELRIGQWKGPTWPQPMLMMMIILATTECRV